MKQDSVKTEDQQPVAPNGADLRAAPRFTLLLRSAKLLCTQGEFLCILRDVSETGVRLKLFHPLPHDEKHFLLEQPCGERLMAELVWERDNQAGFRFAGPIDVTRFLTEEHPYPRRSIRMNVTSPVTIFLEGRTITATLRNLSREGAKVDAPVRLAIGQRLRIVGEDLREFDATVCWRKSPDHGLSFHQSMDLGELALTVAMMNLRYGGGDQPPHATAA